MRKSPKVVVDCHGPASSETVVVRLVSLCPAPGPGGRSLMSVRLGLFHSARDRDWSRRRPGTSESVHSQASYPCHSNQKGAPENKTCLNSHAPMEMGLDQVGTNRNNLLIVRAVQGIHRAS